MQQSDFNALTSQIEGLAQAFRVLSFQLQQQGAVDRLQLQAALRIHADEHLRGDQCMARPALLHLADQMLADEEAYRDQLSSRKSAQTP